MGPGLKARASPNAIIEGLKFHPHEVLLPFYEGEMGPIPQCSELIPGSELRDHSVWSLGVPYGVWELTWVQGKCAPSAASPAPKLGSLSIFQSFWNSLETDLLWLSLQVQEPGEKNLIPSWSVQVGKSGQQSLRPNAGLMLTASCLGQNRSRTCWV